MLAVLIFSGYATSFYRSPGGLLLLFSITLFIYFYRGVKLNRKIFTLITVWTLYCLAMMLLYGELFPGFYFRHIVYFFSGYVIISIFRYRLFRAYEDIIYYLAIVSLFFFTWQLIDLPSLTALMETFDIANYSEVNGLSTKNILLYTLHRSEVTRNAGFAWEPGPFSIFLAIAVYFNLMRTNSVVKNKRFLVLVLTIFTTFSTTGILILFVILLYLYVVDKKLTVSKITSSTILIAVIIYGFFTLDFLFPKIEMLYSSSSAEQIIQQANASGVDVKKSFGRFAAFEMGWIDFQRNPILGYAGSSSNKYSSNIGVDINMVSGLPVIFGMYGILWILLALIYLNKSSYNIAKLFNSKSKYMFVVIFFISLFSFHSQIFVVLYAFLFSFMLKPQPEIQIKLH